MEVQMIRSLFALSLKNKLSKWWNAKSIQIESEYKQKELDLVAQCEIKQNLLQDEISEKLLVLEKKKRDVEDITARVQDREKELVRVNEDLKTQIRLIEAKASPSHVWESAFSLGVSKSWDMMIPLMTKGLEKVKEKIRAEEIESSFPRIDLIVEQRIKETGNISLIEKAQITKKKKEFEARRSKTDDEIEKQKLTNYISVLDWVMDGNNGN